MKIQNLKSIEGVNYRLYITTNSEYNLTDFTIQGACARIGRCEKSSVQFTVAEVTDKSLVLIIPSLECGNYQYEVTLTNNNTKQVFQVLQGRIEVANRIGCLDENTISPEYATVDVLINAESVEVQMSIDKGMQGDKGEKGDKGEQGYSAYEVATHHGYNGSEELWVAEFEGAQEAAAAAKSSAEEALLYKDGTYHYYNMAVDEAMSARNSSEESFNYMTTAKNEATTATSAATTAVMNADLAEQYKNATINYYNLAVEAREGAESYYEQSKDEYLNAKSAAEDAKNYSNESGLYYTQSANSATYAYQSAAAAESSAAAAASSAAAAASSAAKLGNAALKNASNTFSGTNTFNNVTKVTVAPNSYTSVMNEEASILLDFVQQAGIRNVNTYLSKVTGSGAQSEDDILIRYTVPKNNTVSVWKGGTYPFYKSAYFNWASVWIPIYTNINQKTNSATGCKFRFITSLATNIQGATDTGDIGIKIIKQSSDINKPFLNFNNIKTNHHCAVVEILCEIENKKLKWTLYSPVFSSGKVELVKVTTFTTTSGSHNYSNDTGFLFVYSANNKAKIFFREFHTGNYRWIYCGEVDMRNGMFNGNDYDRTLIFAGSGNDSDFFMYMPKKITFLPYWVNNGIFSNCQQILQAVTSTDFTETILTIDEYNALQA